MRFVATLASKVLVFNLLYDPDSIKTGTKGRIDVVVFGWSGMLIGVVLDDLEAPISVDSTSI